MARILIVDDDELVRRTVKLTLARAKHDVIEAADGEKALEQLVRRPVDLVVTDIIMPEVDGIGLILAVRKQYPKVGIVAISGGSRTTPMDFLAMAGPLGASVTLPKPFTAEQLLKAVDEALKKAAPPASPSGT